MSFRNRLVLPCPFLDVFVWCDKRGGRQAAFWSDQRGCRWRAGAFRGAPGTWGLSVLQLRHFIQVRSQHFGSFYVVVPDGEEQVMALAGVPRSRHE